MRPRTNHVRLRPAASAAQSAQHHQRLWRVAEHRPAGERSLEPFDIGERRLIRRRRLHHVKKALERLTRVADLVRAQQSNHLLERRACLARYLRPDAPNLLEVSNDAV